MPEINFGDEYELTWEEAENDVPGGGTSMMSLVTCETVVLFT
jgi:hypothetical protein